MPFNRVNNTKAINLWLLILSSASKKKSKEQKHEKPVSVPECWCPGMMVVPLPQAGCILGYWDMGYWAALFYVLGSIVYVVDSFYLWPYFYSDSNDDPADPGVYLNTLAAGMFVINALLCFLDWYMQREQLSVMNMIVDENITGGFQLQSISTTITWYYFFNNFFFLGAAVVFLVQAFWEEDPRMDVNNCSLGLCGIFWVNFWGNFLYLISSVFAYLEYVEDAKMREKQGLPPLTLLPYTWESFDWFGWGDILYVATSLLQTVQPFFMFFPSVTDDFNNGFYLNANIFFLIDSLAYFFGYLIFLFDMRRALHTGQVPIQQTGPIQDMLADAVPLDQKSFSESFSSSESGSGQYPNFRRVESGYITVDEIREKLMVANEMRSHRASDPTDRMTSPVNRIASLQSSSLVKRNSESSFRKLSKIESSSVDNLLLWGSKRRSSTIDEGNENDLNTSLLSLEEKEL